MTVPTPPSIVGGTDKLGQWATQNQQQALGDPSGGLLSFGTGGQFGDTSSIYLPGYKPFQGIRPQAWDVRTPTQAQQGERNTVTAREAKSMPLSWAQNDPETLKKFVNTGVLNKVPGFDVGMGMPEIMKAWENLLQQSWMMNQYMPGGSEKKLTPWDVLNSYGNSAGKFGTVKRGDWEYDIATGEKVKYVGPKSKTQTNTRIDLTNPADVKAIATQALAQALGRAPTAAELGSFRSTINNLEQQNPVVQTVTQNFNEMGEVESSNTQQTGGVSEAAKAAAVSEAAKQGPEYGKYQSGTTYWGALMQMLGGGA